MKIPRVRLTVRRMMAVVAAVAILMGGLVGAWQRHDRFMRLSDAHSGIAGRIEMEAVGPESVMSRAELLAAMKTVHWHDEVAGKYRFAASRPWLSVEPGPPGSR